MGDLELPFAYSLSGLLENDYYLQEAREASKNPQMTWALLISGRTQGNEL
jgi:hypothetical protein